MLNKKMTVRQTVMARALAIAFGSVLISTGVTSPAFAQSNATGTIFGQVPATSGLTIVLENSSTNVHRTITPDAQGKYQATSMPPGSYKVKLMRGTSVEKTLEIEALVGQGVEASFRGDDGVQSVTVSAKINRIDVSNTNNGAVFTAKELAKLPMTQDLQAIIKLAPGTVKNTLGTYGNVSSFGGAGVSENAYYINGFPVTNILSQVGASELPFGAIANAQVLSGGYGAEFGRATGGVVNITTKSGTNNWEVGAKVSLAPNALRAAPLNEYFPNTGTHPDTDGKLQYYSHDNIANSRTIGLYAGGPLIMDKLFAFVAAETTHGSSAGVGASSETPHSTTGYSEGKSDLGRYLIKLDYNLTDNHHFEFTKIHDKQTSTSKSFGYDYATLQRDYSQKGGSTSVNCCGGGSNPGADDSIFKYTGYLSDDFTLTALYGKSKTLHSVVPEGYNPSFPRTSSDARSRVPGLSYPKLQQFGDLITPGVGDNQQTLRLDLEYKLGEHSLRAGVDRNNVDSVVGKTQAGGREWAYRFATDPITGQAANPDTFKPYNAFETLTQGGGYGAQGYYVSENLNYNFAHPTSTQSAEYIQDRYQMTQDVLLDLGLRDEQFTNNNSAHQAIFSQRHQIAPRLGITWDVNRDGSMKVFANAGRYFMQVPTNLSSNLAGVFVSTQKYYTYTGIDQATGAPTGLHAISDVVSANNAFGKVSDPRGITAIDIKPLYQDEMSLGFEKAFSASLNFGVMATYRKLKSSNDDMCDQRPINAWGLKHGYPNLADEYGFPCAVINPGEANSLWLDLQGDGKLTRVDLSAADIGLPKVKRIYAALNFFAEHPLRDGWYGKINYTYSQSKGNNEGQVDSTQGGDVGLTVGWDHKELMIGADGYLPNDRTHVIKAYGFYQINSEFTVGANLQIASGRPRNCTGNLPESVGPDLGYGSSYFFCHGVATPRGSQGRLPWSAQLDMNLGYQPAYLKGVIFKVDVFNLFNSSTINSETSDSDSKFYLQGGSRTAPRSARLTAEYNYKF